MFAFGFGQEQDEACPVCLEHINVTDNTNITRNLCCGKCLHSSCLEDIRKSKMSAEQKGQCPLCREVYSPEDSPEHWKLLQQWVEKKKPWAQLMLGQKILDDQGDKQVVAMLFRLASEQGNPIAQFNLGVLYSDGYGVVQSDTMMKAWFLEAANQGYAPAIKSLSELVEDDILHATAVYRLCGMYYEGLGVVQCEVTAAKYAQIFFSLPGATKVYKCQSKQTWERKT